MTKEMQLSPKDHRILKSIDRPMTPVYGVSVAPKGLSGLLRRAAYDIHEHKARRSMLLLLADRIDVLESGVTDLVKRRPIALVLGALGAIGAVMAVKLLRRPV